MSAKQAAEALLELDAELSAFAAGLEGCPFPEKRDVVRSFIRESVMNTWTLKRRAIDGKRQEVTAATDLTPGFAVLADDVSLLSFHPTQEEALSAMGTSTDARDLSVAPVEVNQTRSRGRKTGDVIARRKLPSTSVTNTGGIRDEDIDTSEIPELGASFFATAVLTRPGESLLGTTKEERAHDGKLADSDGHLMVVSLDGGKTFQPAPTVSWSCTKASVSTAKLDLVNCRLRQPRNAWRLTSG